MNRKTPFAPGEIYHLYNRGSDKRNIFTSEGDYERFIRLLYLCNGSNPVDLKLQGETLLAVTQADRGAPLVDLGAYCLMPNHFHLVVREKEGINISRFMRKLSTAYTMYFNKKYERNGGLFQGAFKSVHAKDDRYLSYLIAYVHLNPIKLFEPSWKETGIKNRAGAESYLREYRYSSYLDYCGTSRLENLLLSADALPQYYTTPSDFRKSVEDWLSYTR